MQASIPAPASPRRRRRHVITIAVICASALFIQAFTAPAPARADEGALGTELEAVQTQAETDPAGAASSLQSVLDDVGSTWATNISNFLGGLQAADAEFWSVVGKLFVGWFVILIRGIMCAFGEWLCELAPTPTL